MNNAFYYTWSKSRLSCHTLYKLSGLTSKMEISHEMSRFIFIGGLHSILLHKRTLGGHPWKRALCPVEASKFRQIVYTCMSIISFIRVYNKNKY